MTNKTVRNSINSGITFAIIIIFLALIGFTTTGAVLIAKVFGHAPAANKQPGIEYLMVFLGLLGLWNGARAVRSDSSDEKLSGAVISSLIAGLTCGILTAAFSLIYSAFIQNKIDPRAYLAMVTPDTMKLFLFNLTGATPFVIHLVLLTVTGILGGMLTFFLRRFSVGKKIAGGFGKLKDGISSNTAMTSLRHAPYSIYILYAVIAVVLFLVPRSWGSYWNYIMGTVGIYVILGLGLNIIVGLAGQLVLGYVAFFAIGAYSVALLTAPQPHNLQWNFWLVLIIGVILSGIAGILLGLPILRLRGDYLAIVTLGFGEIIRILLKSDLLTDFTGGPKGVRNIAGPTLFGQSFTSDIDFMYLIIIAVLVTLFICYRLQNSRTGRSWVAIREDEIAARATGINTFQSKLLALAIGAALAGLGGVLFASRNQFTGPEDHVMMVSINVLCQVIVGGMGSIPGVFLGAFALKGLPEMLRELDIYRLMFFGGLLVMMMILRPEGLWPASRPRLANQSEPKAASKEQEQPAKKAADVEGVQHASKS